MTPSRLSANADAVDISSGQVFVPFTRDVGNGTDITIDGTDPTTIHLTAGVYLIQFSGSVSGGTATSAQPNLKGSGLIGCDGGPAISTGLAPLSPQLIGWITTTAGTLSVEMVAAGASAGDSFQGGIDILKLGGA